MGKIVKKVVSVALPVVLGALGTAIGGPLGGLIGAGLGSIGASALAPQAKRAKASPEAMNRLRANVDPLTPRKTVIGITAMATDIRDEEFTDNQEQFHRFIVCASHKVQSIDEIWFDDELAWSTTGGIQSKFLGYLGVEGYPEGSAANAKNISARMGSTRRFTGMAWVYLRYKLTGNSKKTDSPFAQSIPTRITIRGKGAALYDPRLDSTAGGSGSQRANDQSTWVWNDNASRNPALALLFYLLGYRINGKLAVGKGIPASRIDLESFITAANLCDELVPKVGGGTEPRYRCDGVWSEGDDPTTVIDMLKATMNADLDDVGGKLRLTVFHNDLATPVADFGDNDLIDAFSWQPLPPLDATFNVVRGLYTDPSNQSLYQQVDYPEQREASLDGIDRIDTFNLPMVQSPGQAQRLAQLRLQRQKYAGVFEAEFQATAWKVSKNSIIRLTFGQTGFAQKFFRVAEMEIRQDGRVPLKLREEDPAIYGDPPLTGPISPIFSTPFDPARSPFVQAINRWQGTYSPTTTYVLDDLVTGPGNSGWRYINATPAAGQALPIWPATSNAYWEVFTAPVNPPDIGVEEGATRNVPRGTYDAGTTYVRGDSVLFAGSSYQLIVNSSTGNAPPDVARWALLANAGSGPPGADGLPGLTVIVSNEAHVVATAPDGSGGDYSAAGGQMRLLRGSTVLTPTFSIPAKTPNTSWISIDSTGNYTVTDPGVDLATATLRAVNAGVSYDRTYTLAKSKQGVTGPRLALVADTQAFTFTDGAANPGSQTITLTALLNNLSGTATWTTTPSVTLGGTGNTRTLSVASFGSNRQVTVEATLGGITDRITVVRLDRDAFGGNANRVPFSRMEGDRGWKVAFNPSALVTTPVFSETSGRRFFATIFNTTASGQLMAIGSEPLPLSSFPAQPGERLSVQARVTALGPISSWFLNLWYVRADGTRTAVNVASGTSEITLGVANQLNFVDFPTGGSPVVGAHIDLLAQSSGVGFVQIAISEPMVTSAAPDQTIHPPFSPGPNASDGADPNNLITIDGGILSGIGTADIFVDNTRAALQGLASARPPSGQFIGQEYHATDTREIVQWDGFNWRSSADITALAQRSIEPQFPSIEVKQGQAGHTGDRTVTHSAKRGTATISGGTWSLPAQNLGAGSASVNSASGTVTLSGIAQSGSYTLRYTHTDGFVTEITVNVSYIPEAATGSSAKVGRQAVTTSTADNSDWQTILTLTVTGAPTGRVNFGGNQGLSFLEPQGGIGTNSFEARLLLDGVTLVSLTSQPVTVADEIEPTDFAGLFNGSYAVGSGTRVFMIQLRRTFGTGVLNVIQAALEATIIAS